mmetsp:Transcript_25225/g.57350  ORF Transcript_25225/g.57350 Transcript_25225/m.57350 type:complete len:145 (+) Transcript_25225:747-1181(+)
MNWGVPTTGVLHRDLCVRRRDGYIKDLSKLGRKMNKLVMIDHDPLAFSRQPENGIQIRPYTGDPDDMELKHLMHFLKDLAVGGHDTRNFIEAHGGGDEDLGQRYAPIKAAELEKVARRRSIGRAFSIAKTQPVQPTTNRFGARI